MTRTSRPDVILFSTADWASKYWTNKQHIAARLAARGHRVLYVETVGLRTPGLNAPDARRMLARLRRGLAPLQQGADNLWVLSPLTVPLGHGHQAVNAVNAWQLRTRIRAFMRAHGVQAPWIWTYHPYMLDAVDGIAPSRLIYHCADDLGAMPGIDRDTFDRAERRLLERADVVFTTSLHLQARCAAVAGDRVHYFRNVADVDHFGAARSAAVPADLAAVPRPRLGYVGVLSDFKIDFALLDAVARARPDWSVVLIGGERVGQADPALAELARRPNVHLLGWRPYEALPAYLAGLDVALLPQRLNDYTRAMFPMKFFEYIAAGLPVVSTPIDALREFKAIYRVAGDPAAFVDAIRMSLEQRAAPLPLTDPVLRENSWDSRLDRMLAVIDASAPCQATRRSAAAEAR